MRRIKHEQATGRAYVSRKAGWRPDQGMAGHAACERCLEAAEEHAEGLPNPAFCKVGQASSCGEPVFLDLCRPCPGLPLVWLPAAHPLSLLPTQVLSSSMVSGGFWMEQPRGLRE